MIRRRSLLAASAVLAAPAVLRAQSRIKLSMYYPIAVGGPIPDIVDGYCRDFQKASGVEVTPVYAGNYGDALTKSVTAIRAGQGRRWRCCWPRDPQPAGPRRARLARRDGA